MTDPENVENFTAAQQAGLNTRIVDQDRTLDAIHQLEAVVASAAYQREVNWRDEVLAALGVLDATLSEEEDNAARPDSLLSDIKRTQPLLASRVRGVRAQYRQLRDTITSLTRELQRPGGDADIDFSDIRQRLAWVSTALRHQRARESDLIYEAYYHAFQSAQQHPRSSRRRL